jgi:hypothetical protein
MKLAGGVTPANSLDIRTHRSDIGQSELSHQLITVLQCLMKMHAGIDEYHGQIWISIRYKAQHDGAFRAE